MIMGVYVVKPVSGDDGTIHHILSRRIITHELPTAQARPTQLDKPLRNTLWEEVLIDGYRDGLYRKMRMPHPCG